MTAPKLLRPADLAERLGCSRATAYRLIESAAIETVRIGSLVRVTEDALNRYIARSTVPARAARRVRSVAS